MIFKRTIKRFAHVTGFTFVSYTENGDIITCGSRDGDIRIWKEISDDDPQNQCIGENAYCCIQYVTESNKKRMLASSENTVKAYNSPDFAYEGVELRCGAAVSTIKANKKWVVAGCVDSKIKVQSADKNEDPFDLDGHSGPILNIDLGPNDYLSSSAGDGTIRVWNLRTKQPVKTFEGLENTDKFENLKYINTPAFDKKGNYLAFPKGKIINLVDTSSWEITHRLENEDIEGRFTACSFSHCGSYVAAGSDCGEMCIWDVANDNMKIKGDYVGDENNPITSIEWNPKVLELAFTDLDGQLSTILVKSEKTEENSAKESDRASEVNDPDDIYNEIDFHADSDNENSIALNKIKNDTLKGDVSDLDSIPSQASVKSVVSRVKPFIVQPPFQPGSTPNYLESRFMMWNHIGQVICHKSTDENSIVVEFNDASLHSSIHIVNTLDHQLASLSETCLALATTHGPSKLVCIALLSSGSKEWSNVMPECEEIQAVAAGKSFVAVATDAGYLRFFTTMGTQREVIMLPGPVVCLSAFDNKLVAAYHTSNTCNKYSLMIVNIVGLTMSNRTVEIPLNASTKLSWLGFSDMESVITYETSGRVLSYNIKRNVWMPICDLTESVIGASDTFFIVSVSEKMQKVRATLCRGTNFPHTNPRPILREIDYVLPLCSIETEKSKLEETLVRATNFEVESTGKIILENALKLFSIAMNSELESRAYELVELINDRKLIEFASKYAGQRGRIHMSNKISKLLNDFEEKEKQKQKAIEVFEKESEEFVESYEVNSTKNESEKMHVETSTPLIAPRSMISQKKLANPFKKSTNAKSSLTNSSLSHLTKKSIGYNESINSDDENTPTNNLTTSNSSISTDTPRPGNFPQWFIANKSDLRSDHPQATEPELLKIGKNIYLGLTGKNKSIDISQESVSTSLNKRKLDLHDESGGTAKLAKFTYSEGD